MFGILSCSEQEALDTASLTLDTINDTISTLPENFEAAAPMLQEDLETLWYNVSGTVETYAHDIGVSEPEHPLADNSATTDEPLQLAEEAREQLISGTTFNELLATAAAHLTQNDLENIETTDINALNGILPFDVDLESCGENMAEVLNSLDIGQVSAILQSELGYHLIQVLDRNGGRVQIGHIIFEIDPQVELADESTDENLIAEETDPVQDAISRLAGILDNQ